MGSHPGWSRPAYLGEGETNVEDVVYSDPLVVELPTDYIDALWYEWKEARRDDPLLPFRVSIAPDSLHKANVSGGPPYELSADRPLVDSIVWNEMQCQTFVSYLRDAASWRGFPGLRFEAEAEGAVVAADLDPLEF